MIKPLRPSLMPLLFVPFLILLFACIGCNTKSEDAVTKYLYDQLGFDVKIYNWRPEPVSKELRDKIEVALADPELMKENRIESSPNGRWMVYMLYEEKGEFAGWTDLRISSGWYGAYRSHHRVGSRLFLKNTLTGDIYDIYDGDNRLQVIEGGSPVQEYYGLSALESPYVADNGTLIYSISYIKYQDYDDPAKVPLSSKPHLIYLGHVRIIADIESLKKKCIGRIDENGFFSSSPGCGFGLSRNGRRVCLDYNEGKYCIVDITDFHLVYSCERGNILGNTPDFEYVVEYLWNRSDSDCVYLVKTDINERKSLGSGDSSFWERGDVFISPNGKYVLNDFMVLIYAKGGTADEIGCYPKIGIYRDDRLFLGEFPRSPEEGAFYIHQWLDEYLAESSDSDESLKLHEVKREIDNYGNVTMSYGEDNIIQFIYNNGKYFIEPPDTEGVTIREIDRAYLMNMNSRVTEVIE